MLLMIIFIPVQIIVPLVFAIMDFEVSTLVALGVIIVAVPFESFFVYIC
jgi:hypothetical protein